jgi:hypothetical protein
MYFLHFLSRRKIKYLFKTSDIPNKEVKYEFQLIDYTVITKFCSKIESEKIDLSNTWLPKIEQSNLIAIVSFAGGKDRIILFKLRILSINSIVNFKGV